MSMLKNCNLIERVFKTKEGKVVLWQFPNLPIIVWGIGLLVAKTVSTGTIHNIANAISFGAIFTWAWLEIFQGVNFFRRALGLIILVIILLNTIN